jgi:REP element-mobilizing transposase RayT
MPAVMQRANERNRHSVRLPDYDYSQPGAYFVTICTKDRRNLFGGVVNEEMCLSRFGGVVKACWEDLPRHFAEVDVNEFVVMPNYIHGIVVLVDGMGTACRAHTTERYARPVTGSLPTIIRSFKSAATKRINEIRRTPGQPVWQRNYYEHVVRTEEEMNRIREYIAGNPATWHDDVENPASEAFAKRRMTKTEAPK